MSRSLRVAVALGLLALVVWRTGTAPFVSGVRALDAPTLAVGSGIAVVTTVACAWRWHLVAAGLRIAVPLPTAVGACYRAQFLNTVLPGGVLGDVHRGLAHGREAGDTRRALRAVWWERAAGQVVLLVVAAVGLLLLPSPVRHLAPVVLGTGGVVLLGALLVVLLVTRSVLRLVPHAWPGVVLASTVAVAGHVVTYLLAARAVGVTDSVATLLPLTLLVLVAAGLPVNVAGWGPREGVAAWVFAAAGLGAGAGVAAAVAYGGIVLVANLPGALVLLAGTRRPAPSATPVLAPGGAVSA